MDELQREEIHLLKECVNCAIRNSDDALNSARVMSPIIKKLELMQGGENAERAN